MEKHTTDLRQVVDEAMHLLGHMLPASIQLRLEQPDTSPVWISADTARIKQVLVDLAANARNAMPQGGDLIVTLLTTHPQAINPKVPAGQSFAQLSVRDTGMGMTPEVSARVFDPSFTTEGRSDETAQALSTVYAVVKEHGGHIEVTSQPGTGTTFVVSLPLAEALSPEGEGPSDQQAGPAATGTVILAEDNEPIRRLIHRSLEAEGFTVVEAPDGAALLESHRQLGAAASLMIVDLDLPRVSGLAAVKQIRDAGALTPAIFITGSSGAELETALLPATSLMRKPFRIGELRDIVTRVMASSHAHA